MRSIVLLIILLAQISTAQTRDIVPRSDGEGSVGTLTQQWGSVAASNIYLRGVALDTSSVSGWYAVPPPTNAFAWQTLQATVVGGVTQVFWSSILGPQGVHTGAYTNVLTYTPTTPNTNQSLIVPAGVTNLFVKLWGAAGGSATPLGGEGACVGGFIACTPGEELLLIVGSGGIYGGIAMTNAGGIPGGGEGRAIGTYGAGGGGGYSALYRGTNLLLLAAGGGGSGGDIPTGGAGGNLTGTNGLPAGVSSAGGTGGSQTAGGVTNGAFLLGGNGAYSGTGNQAGGGGGGGYWGGGGGLAWATGNRSGGGGGSSYVPAMYAWGVRGRNPFDEDYQSGVAQPVSGNTGGNGMAKVRYP